MTKAVEGDQFELVNALSAVHPAEDQAALAEYFRRPELAVVTLTITEAGYHATKTGTLDIDRPEVAADLAALRTSALGTSALGTDPTAAPVRTARPSWSLASRPGAGPTPAGSLSSRATTCWPTAR